MTFNFAQLAITSAKKVIFQIEKQNSPNIKGGGGVGVSQTSIGRKEALLPCADPKHSQWISSPWNPCLSS